jgi:hypothetical protein
MHHTLYVAAGKHGRQSLVASSNCNNSATHLYVMDQYMKMSFLVNTGANLGIYPCSHFQECQTQTSYELFKANDTTVHTYGCISLHLDLGLRREFSWHFVIADVMGPIVGLSLFLQLTRLHKTLTPH